MGQIRLRRVAARMTSIANVIYNLTLCYVVLTSCGRIGLFASKTETTSGGPVPEHTVIPPVPVLGSYLTSILMDEFSKPIALADVLANDGLFTARTNDKGILILPVSLIKDSAVELDVKVNGQSLFINVQLPTDIADALHTTDSAAGTELPRTMGIRIAYDQALLKSGPSNRFPAETLSLPPEAAQNVNVNTPVLNFAVTSHKNTDAVPENFTLAGTCDSGQRINVIGDLTQPVEGACSGDGTFQLKVTLSISNGVKNLTLMQTDLSTGLYVAQLLTLSRLGFLVPPNLTAASVAGLRPILKGTCDSTATSHSATTTAGTVRSVTCQSGELTINLRLPVGTPAFSVEATSTNGPESKSSGLVNFSSTATTCPVGYVGVPASNINGLGNASASNGHANWWLDTSLDFCVMKYPAKNNNGSTFATSTVNGVPWGSLSRGADDNVLGSALKACKDAGSGYRLISNTQWQTVARNAEGVPANWSGNSVGAGAFVRGHSDGVPQRVLENALDTDPYFDTGNSAAEPVGSGWEQKRTHILSNGSVVWDFGGNVSQWVSDDASTLGINPAIDQNFYEYTNTARFPTTGGGVNRLLFGPSGAFTSAANIGQMLGGSGGVVARAGWYDMSITGIFGADLRHNPTYNYQLIGFRCVYLPGL